MSCDRPVLMHRCDDGSVHCGAPSGRRDGVVFEVPCGNCKGCHILKAQAWGVRTVHEASLYGASRFLTLTYSDEYLPADGSVSKLTLRNFHRRLRERFPDMRYVSCGEYGGRTSRAHYHCCVFNCDLPMGKPVARGASGSVSYDCDELAEIWGLGQVAVGYVTSASGAYVGAHAVKDAAEGRKRGPDGRLEPWLSIDPRTGECRPRVPPFRVQSAGGDGAIGLPWLYRFHKELRDGLVPARISNETRWLPAPLLYLRHLERIEPERAEYEKQARLMALLEPENVAKSSAYARAARIAIRDARSSLGREVRPARGDAQDALVEFEDAECG